MKRLLVLLLIVVAAATCCTPLAWAAGEDDTVLVTWRDLRITQSDFDAALLGLPEGSRLNFQFSMRRITDLLNTMLLNRTLAAEGRQLGLDEDPLIQKEMALAADRVLVENIAEPLLWCMMRVCLWAQAPYRLRIS